MCNSIAHLLSTHFQNNPKVGILNPSLQELLIQDNLTLIRRVCKGRSHKKLIKGRERWGLPISELDLINDWLDIYAN
jgi:hypothetical protein